MGDVGHGLGVFWETWVVSGSWVWSTLNDSLRSFITSSISVCWVGKSSGYFLWTHALIVLGKNICPYWLVVRPIYLNFILCFLLEPLQWLQEKSS